MKKDKVSKKRYYKVLNNERNSIKMSEREDKEQISVHYPINEWTKPKIPNSKLMVFSTYDAAVDFAVYNKGIIVKCLIKNRSNLKLMSCWKERYSLICEFWKNVNSGKHMHPYSFPPILTDAVYCDEVYCLG